MLDYYEDLKSLAKCKNLADLDKAKLNSLTNMGEGRSETELREVLEKLRYKV